MHYKISLFRHFVLLKRLLKNLSDAEFFDSYVDAKSHVEKNQSDAEFLSRNSVGFLEIFRKWKRK